MLASDLPGFNPCYVGLWSVSDDEGSGGVDDYVFQSLLCWIMVCKPRPDRAYNCYA